MLIRQALHVAPIAALWCNAGPYALKQFAFGQRVSGRLVAHRAMDAEMV
jgi:hypothetical protein